MVALMVDRILVDRFALTPVCSEDLEELFALRSMPEVNLFNPAGPDKTIDTTREILDEWIGDWKRDGIGYCTARVNDTGAYVGYVGIAVCEFEGEQLFNLAYRIRPEFQGQGFVTRACKAVLEHVRSSQPEFLGMRVRVLTKHNNKPSLAVAQRLGFVHDAEIDNRPDDGDVSLFVTL
ncbi:GNAT family N-acetyltransferase [Alloscardovia omnicolens]|uniref:GNAT family N-acetyltransferase n=1 Tax=Alloscardovia omnicolens TaxID=419015 RepID=UPI003A67419C